MEIIVFTDGACSGNPGPGGWGAVVATPDGQVKELGGGSDLTTNNEMELMAVIQALVFLRDDSRPVTVYTDSTYVIRGITQWVWGWTRNSWKNAEGQDVANQECWKKLLGLTLDRKKISPAPIQWKYSRGHVGTPGNERCDEIAVHFSKGKYISLYEGSLLNYPIAIYDLPEDTELPEMKPKGEKKAAYAYLSLVGGVAVRHSDWASCEKRVKGQSGAKFKKVMSESELQELLKSWGAKLA